MRFFDEITPMRGFLSALSAFGNAFEGAPGASFSGGARWRPRARHVLYLVLFLSSWAIFFAYSYGCRLLEASLAAAVNRGAERGVLVDSPRLEGVLPTLSAREIVLDTDTARLSLEEVRAGVHLFPPHVSVSSRLAGGSTALRLEPASPFSPFPLRVRGELKGVSLPDLMTGIRKELPITVNDGTIGLHMDVSVAKAPRNAGALSGRISLTLSEGRLRHGLPVLRVEELTNIRGRAEIALSAGNVGIERLFVESGDIAREASGTLRLAGKPAQTGLDLRATLALPPERANLELLPRRTRRQMETKGKVLVRIGGTVASPLPNLVER